ncbi:MAG: hypothetical protein AB1649_09110 [Chloroflexota bacterium]
MDTYRHRPLTIDTEQYFFLAPIPPFVDICLETVLIDRRDFSKITQLAANYRNDPRMIEMVRKAGDASAKVPYLMAVGETPGSILFILREIAQPYIEFLQRLPDEVQATIHLLLSLNRVPDGCEMYALPALLEIDRIQGGIVGTLRRFMSGRQLAREFHDNSLTALQTLDHDWPRLRHGKGPRWPRSPLPLPEQPEMQYVPFFDRTGRLIRLHERCVIVDAPGTRELQRFIPPVLQRPLPPTLSVATPGSADWLIHEVGKVGRHFTRALLEIIKDHLAAEQVEMDVRNYAQINQHAQDALQEYVGKTP